ncbi:hypothetical protein KAS79_01225 [Candidatus Parcubacteria bacterium]|nr:hypothetical protein [Candidatus Parcubacteria bacterium]
MEQWIIVLGIIVYGMIAIVARGVFDIIWKDWTTADRNLFAALWWLPLIISMAYAFCTGISAAMNEVIVGIVSWIKIIHEIGKRIGMKINKIDLG